MIEYEFHANEQALVINPNRRFDSLILDVPVPMGERGRELKVVDAKE